MGVSGWMFLLVPAYPGCPGKTAVKWLLLLAGPQYYWTGEVLEKSCKFHCLYGVAALNQGYLRPKEELVEWREMSWLIMWEDADYWNREPVEKAALGQLVNQLNLKGECYNDALK